MDGISSCENRFFNTLPLSSLLQEADMGFRQAVIAALIKEGFELDEAFPCLQHPIEILEAICWLEALGFGSAWESFQQALLTAGKLGILMDTSMRKPRILRASSSTPSGWQAGYALPRLETA